MIALILTLIFKIKVNSQDITISIFIHTNKQKMFHTKIKKLNGFRKNIF